MDWYQYQFSFDLLTNVQQLSGYDESGPTYDVFESEILEQFVNKTNREFQGR